MRPVVFDHTTASTGGFVSVPDTKEHEDLARRVAEIEALFGRFSTGYKAFEGTYRAQTAQLTEYNTRLATVEQKCDQMGSQIKLLTDRVSSLDRADQRNEGTMNGLQNRLDRMEAEIRRLAALCMAKHDTTERYEPKGFQQNDQPARFMGSGRM
jgi:chromosome segregation ATPase